MRQQPKAGAAIFRGFKFASALFVLQFGVSAAMGQQAPNSPYPNQQQNQQQNQQNQNQPKPPPPPPQNTGPTPAQQAAKAKQLQTDRDAVTKAQQDWSLAVQNQHTLENEYRTAFQQTKPWLTASKALNDARSALDAARQSVVDNLAKDNDYQQALADKKQAQSDLDAAKASPDSSPQTLTPLAQHVLDAATKVSQMEKEAMDDDTNVLAARTRVTSAQADVNQLNTQFQSSLAVTKDFKDAKAATDAARDKVQKAQAKLSADGG